MFKYFKKNLFSKENFYIPSIFPIKKHFSKSINYDFSNIENEGLGSFPIKNFGKQNEENVKKII